MMYIICAVCVIIVTIACVTIGYYDVYAEAYNGIMNVACDLRDQGYTKGEIIDMLYAAGYIDGSDGSYDAVDRIMVSSAF